MRTCLFGVILTGARVFQVIHGLGAIGIVGRGAHVCGTSCTLMRGSLHWLSDQFHEENVNVAAAKQQALDLIGTLPDDVTTDDILAELYFKTQVDAGLRQLEDGQSHSHETVEQRMAKWTGR